MAFTAAQAKHGTYACSAIAIFILVFRLVISCRRKRILEPSFFVVICSILVDSARLAVNYYILIYGTASDALNNVHYFNTHNAREVQIGSILSLVTRVLTTTSCWLQICLLLLFYSRMILNIKWATWLTRICWSVTGATYMAVILATFLECRPFRLYWQISPDPGVCVHAYVQLLIQCISNIVIDLMLLTISYPILFCKGRTWQQHIRVGLLFVLGSFCIIVTILRLVAIYGSKSAQPTRTMWASIQIVVSTFVANAPTIYGDLRVAKRKKNESQDRRRSRPEVWPTHGSDADSARRNSLFNPQPTHINVSTESGRKDWYDREENQP